MEFRLFDRNTYRATLAQWCQEAEKWDCFPEEVTRKLRWIEEAIEANLDPKGSHKVIPYGVFVHGQDIAAATCELVLSDLGKANGKWLKLLKVTLSPEIEMLIEDRDFAATELAVQAYKSATLGAYDARLEHEADTLKLFGRNDDLLRFQMILMAFLQTDPENASMKATKEGRWLVLKSDTKEEVLQ